MNINDQRDRQGIISLGIGILGMVFWMIPIIGIIVNCIGVFFGIKGLETRFRELSIIGILLGCIGFILTCLRSGLVYFLT